MSAVITPKKRRLVNIGDTTLRQVEQFFKVKIPTRFFKQPQNEARQPVIDLSSIMPMSLSWSIDVMENEHYNHCERRRRLQCLEREGYQPIDCFAFMALFQELNTLADATHPWNSSIFGPSMRIYCDGTIVERNQQKALLYMYPLPSRGTWQWSTSPWSQKFFKCDVSAMVRTRPQ
jgi:hypothetical protein